MGKVIGTRLVLFVIAILILGSCVIKRINLQQNCIGYLKQAADANTVELAQGRLEKLFCMQKKIT